MKHIRSTVKLALVCLSLAACGPRANETTKSVSVWEKRAYQDRTFGSPVAAEQTACGVALKYLTSNSASSRAPSFAGNALAGLGYLLLVVPIAAISDAASAQSLYIVYGPDDWPLAYRLGQPPRCLGSLPDPRDAVDPTSPPGQRSDGKPTCWYRSDFEAFLRLSAPLVNGRVEQAWSDFGTESAAMKYDFPGITAPIALSHDEMVVRPGESLRACLTKPGTKSANKSDPEFQTACVTHWRAASTATRSIPGGEGSNRSCWGWINKLP